MAYQQGRVITIFERYTDRARRVVIVAGQEAHEMKHDQLGTEHLLLGLLQCEGIAGEVLLDAGLSPGEVREKILTKHPKGSHEPPVHVPFDSRARKTVELALREALQLGHNYIGTEHLLLALIREGGGIGCLILSEYSPAKDIRQAVIKVLHGNMKSAKAEDAVTKITEDLKKVFPDPPLSIPDRLDQLEVRLRIAEQMLGLR